MYNGYIVMLCFVFMLLFWQINFFFLLSCYYSNHSTFSAISQSRVMLQCNLECYFGGRSFKSQPRYELSRLRSYWFFFFISPAE